MIYHLSSYQPQLATSALYWGFAGLFPLLGTPTAAYRSLQPAEATPGCVADSDDDFFLVTLVFSNGSSGLQGVLLGQNPIRVLGPHLLLVCGAVLPVFLVQHPLDGLQPVSGVGGGIPAQGDRGAGVLEGVGVSVDSDKGSLSNVLDVPRGVVAPQRTGIVGGALLTPLVFAATPTVHEPLASTVEALPHLVIERVF